MHALLPSVWSQKARVPNVPRCLPALRAGLLAAPLLGPHCFWGGGWLPWRGLVPTCWLQGTVWVSCGAGWASRGAVAAAQPQDLGDIAAKQGACSAGKRAPGVPAEPLPCSPGLCRAGQRPVARAKRGGMPAPRTEVPFLAQGLTGPSGAHDEARVGGCPRTCPPAHTTLGPGCPYFAPAPSSSGFAEVCNPRNGRCYFYPLSWQRLGAYLQRARCADSTGSQRGSVRFPCLLWPQRGLLPQTPPARVRGGGAEAASSHPGSRRPPGSTAQASHGSNGCPSSAQSRPPAGLGGPRWAPFCPVGARAPCPIALSGCPQLMAPLCSVCRQGREGRKQLRHPENGGKYVPGLGRCWGLHRGTRRRRVRPCSPPASTVLPMPMGTGTLRSLGASSHGGAARGGGSPAGWGSKIKRPCTPTQPDTGQHLLLCWGPDSTELWPGQ